MIFRLRYYRKVLEESSHTCREGIFHIYIVMYRENTTVVKVKYNLWYKNLDYRPHSVYSESWLVRFLFSAGTIFFSHNNLARTVFFSQFQLSFIKPNDAYAIILISARSRSSRDHEIADWFEGLGRRRG